jgi:hypothetical protein
MACLVPGRPGGRILEALSWLDLSLFWGGREGMGRAGSTAGKYSNRPGFRGTGMDVLGS